MRKTHNERDIERVRKREFCSCLALAKCENKQRVEGVFIGGTFGEREREREREREMTFGQFESRWILFLHAFRG
jgi:hypothetical protein